MKNRIAIFKTPQPGVEKSPHLIYEGDIERSCKAYAEVVSREAKKLTHAVNALFLMARAMAALEDGDLLEFVSMMDRASVEVSYAAQHITTTVTDHVDID